jgi:hypothetical protein
MRKVIAAAIVVLSLSVLPAAEGSRTRPSGAEAARIETHLEVVSRTLRSTSTVHLTDQQREARARVLDWLDEYRRRGVFPHNHVRPGERVPVFVDPHGTPCAVGYLMLRAGEDDLIEEIVRTDNLVRIHTLWDDERVALWLQAHGLTLEEAALIQPAYDWLPPPEPQPVQAVSRAYRPATVGLSVATAALASYAAMGDPLGGAPWADVLTIGIAMGQTLMLVEAADTDAAEPDWAVGLNVFGLVASVGSEISRLLRREDAQRERPATVAVRPYVVPGLYGTEIGFAIRR